MTTFAYSCTISLSEDILIFPRIDCNIFITEIYVSDLHQGILSVCKLFNMCLKYIVETYACISSLSAYLYYIDCAPHWTLCAILLLFIIVVCIIHPALNYF